MFRYALVIFVTLALVTTARSARAEAEIQAYSEELEELARSESSEVVEAEIERARELIRLAEEAHRQGQTTTAQSVLSLIPLQIRLIREILEAARLEQRADELETRLLERRRARRVAREALDLVLERLLALSPLWGDGGGDGDR
jgi:hypothetical protein